MLAYIPDSDGLLKDPPAQVSDAVQLHLAVTSAT